MDRGDIVVLGEVVVVGVLDVDAADRWNADG